MDNDTDLKSQMRQHSTNKVSVRRHTGWMTQVNPIFVSGVGSQALLNSRAQVNQMCRPGVHPALKPRTTFQIDLVSHSETVLWSHLFQAGRPGLQMQGQYVTIICMGAIEIINIIEMSIALLQ